MYVVYFIIGIFTVCSNHDSLGCTFGRPLWPDALEQQLLSDEEEEVAAAAAAAGGAAAGGSVIGSSKLLGTDPASGQPVWIKRGPYGLYVQLVGGIVLQNGGYGGARCRV